MPLYDPQRRAQEPAGASAGLDPTTGATTLPSGAVVIPRARLRDYLKGCVEQEAMGRSWPHRSARREWIRTEVKRRYTQLVNPDPIHR